MSLIPFIEWDKMPFEQSLQMQDNSKNNFTDNFRHFKFRLDVEGVK